MTAKTVVAASSLVIGLATAGCVSFTEVAVETPIQAKLDVSPFQRVLVAGFLGGGTKNLDAASETSRLLRSQLRTKSGMRVIDADALQLVQEVDKRRTSPVAGDTAQDEPRIKTEKDLLEYEPILSDVEYWKKIGQEYQGPLIVTGSVLFTDIARSGVISKPKQYTDQMGRVQVEESREFANQKGYSLTPKFVFIDGRTGVVLHSESFHEEALYNENLNTPALSAYFELMDKLLPGFLNTLSTQKIKGTRILIK
ncbi:MAG TPA: hypothetical protein VN700_07325 [Vicinamibacterales bacterium]|nr:hypothetical protein [Vicinamibacterales bacterium]